MGKKSKINTCSENVIATVDKHVTVHEIANVVHLYSNSKTNDKETFKAHIRLRHSCGRITSLHIPHMLSDVVVVQVTGETHTLIALQCTSGVLQGFYGVHYRAN